MGVNFRVYFHEQLRKKIGRAKSELSIRETDVKEGLEKICDIALELNKDYTKLLEEFEELAETNAKIFTRKSEP